MASTTVITAPVTSSDAVSILSTTAPSSASTSATSAALAVSSPFNQTTNRSFQSSMQPPPQMQSQPSSQQSFTMSQPSSQQNAANGSMYRQYNESARHANENAHVMPIYSVRVSGPLKPHPPPFPSFSTGQYSHVQTRPRIPA